MKSTIKLMLAGLAIFFASQSFAATGTAALTGSMNNIISASVVSGALVNQSVTDTKQDRKAKRDARKAAKKQKQEEKQNTSKTSPAPSK